MSTAAGPGQSSPLPTSAAVLEFICLFTHDLRRKQKRWQDGRLKYHSFNKRVMVYDDRGNFVGDLHWRRDYDFDEGEEVQLERGGVIVQVQDLVHRTEQDLSELLEKRAKEKEQRQVQAAARPSIPSAALPRAVTRPASTGNSQTRHRPLHQIIGTPSGHHGKAVVPKNSPYEQRHQPAESPDERAAKRRKYDDPPPSKTGYAQALFGQSLTLTATPMRSFPARSLPARVTIPEPEPSSSAESSARHVREEPKPALREQPKSSRHFNQPVQRQSLVRKPAENRSVHEVEVVNESHMRRKQDRSLRQNPHIEHHNDSDTLDDDVIEIDDPGAPAPVRPDEAQKAPPKSTRIREKTSDRSIINTRPTKISKTTAASSGEPTRQIHEPQNSSNTKERHHKLKRLESTAPKASVQGTTAQASAPKQKPESQFDGLLRRSSEPTTELRIKSSKKRGLLMVSEIRTKPREKQSGNSSSFHATSEEPQVQVVHHSDDTLRSSSPQPRAGSQTEELRRKGKIPIQQIKSTEPGTDDNPFVSPSQPPSEGLDQSEIKWNGKSTKRRKDSTQLGEDDDPFRSPSPVSLAQNFAMARRSIVGQREDFEIAESFLQDKDVAHGSKSRLHTTTDDLEGRSAAELAQNAAPSSPPRRKIYDPYQLPSSSPELSNNSTPAPPSPTNQTFLNKGHDPDPESPSISNEANHADHSKKTVKSKRIRKVQRNVVLDEEDLGELPKSPSHAIINLDDSDYDANPDSPKAQAKPRRSAKAAKSNPSRQDRKGKIVAADSSMDELDEAEPKKAHKATKRKAKAQEQSPSSETEEQPHKRRRSTRKKGTRAAELEDTPLHSEQDGFENEPASRRSRKNKTQKAAENRPRLTTIKKSIKSRELIGFDLTALNAPLGLRGIGVPFRILSLPADEPTVTIEDEHMMDECSGPFPRKSDEGLLFDTSNTLEAIVEADGQTSPPDKDKASGETTGKILGTAQPAPATWTEGLAARRTSLLEQKCSKPPVKKQGTFSDVSLPKETTALPREKQSSDRPTAENDVAAIRDQVLVEDTHIISEPEPVSDGSKSAIDSGLTSTSSSALLPTAALSEMSQVVRLQSSLMADSNTGNKAPDAAEISAEAHDATTTVVASVQKQIPSLPQQSSRISACNIAGTTLQDIVATEPCPEDHSPAIKEPSRVSAPLHKPISGLRRQLSAFTPVTMVKHDVAQVETRSNIDETPCHGAPPQKPTPDPTRQSSGAALAGSAESSAAVVHPDAGQIIQPTRSPAALIQPPKSLGLKRTTSVIRRINNIAVNCAEPEPSEDPAEESSTKPARLVNPASRGRKAALRSDAAGRVPQRVLPLTQPSAMIPVSTADLASTLLEEPPKEPERPKKKMTFPGFQSARSEGPWSREAFDLLETRRPE